MSLERIAVLTSGGDTPGMNAAVRAVVRTGIAAGVEVLGVRAGYRGLMRGDFVPLDSRAVGGIIGRGGTFLGTARHPEFKAIGGQREAVCRLREHRVDGVVVIGGDGSQHGTMALHTAGMPAVGVASTIDNDLGGLDSSIGVDTALNTAVGLVDRLRDTASSHHRAFLVEVMGRHSGYLALMVGLAAGAELVLTPEIPVSVEQVETAIRAAYAAGKSHFIAIVAEGSALKAVDLANALDADGVGQFEVRLSVLGHVQRGGSPTVFDRLLATRTAVEATTALLHGESGVLAGIVRGRIGIVPLEDALRLHPKVTSDLCAMADTLAR